MSDRDVLRALAADLPVHCTASHNLRAAGRSPLYCVHEHWSFNLYTMPGRIDLPDTGGSHRLRPGTVVLMPPGTRRQFHSDRAGTQWVVHFQPPVSAPSGLVVVDGAARQRDLVFLAEAILACGSMEQRLAVLWHLLWTVRDIAATAVAQPTGHELVDRACTFMRRHLGDALSVAAVVEAVGCSHNHLTRLFRHHCDTTVVGWLRQERLKRAVDLLQGTDLPVSVIAAEVGIPDPQLFNKTVRRHYGCSPTALRQG